MSQRTTDMTIREVWEQCNGVYPNFGALTDRFVEVWDHNKMHLPLFSGFDLALRDAIERGWVSSDERSVVVGTPPANSGPTR